MASDPFVLGVGGTTLYVAYAAAHLGPEDVSSARVHTPVQGKDLVREVAVRQHGNGEVGHLLRRPQTTDRDEPDKLCWLPGKHARVANEGWRDGVDGHTPGRPGRPSGV